MAAQSVPTSREVKLGADFNAQDAMKKNGIHVYNTTSKNRGVALVINIDNEKDKEESSGSESDARQLQMVFEKIGFSVINATSDEVKTRKAIKGLLEKFVVNEKLKEADITVVVIMGSGSKRFGLDFFYAVNGEKIFYDEVNTYFSDKNCPLMKDKPKIVLFQSSRIQDSQETAEDLLRHPHPAESATSGLLVAWTSCSEFLIKLCEELMANAYQHDICTMLDNVYRLMKSPTVDHVIANDLHGEYTKATFGVCYLNPGMYRDKQGVKRFISNDQPYESHDDNELISQLEGLEVKSNYYCSDHMIKNIVLSEGNTGQFTKSYLTSAADNDHLECCIYLLKAGIDVNERDNNGNTALHYAAYNGNLQLCKILVQAGAKATLRNTQENTSGYAKNIFPKEIPLIRAIKRNRTECIDYLHNETSIQLGYVLPKVKEAQ